MPYEFIPEGISAGIYWIGGFVRQKPVWTRSWEGGKVMWATFDVKN